MGIDPIAMTNTMMTSGMDFGGGAALGLTLLGLLVGCAGGVLFSRAGIRWPATVSRPMGAARVGRPAELTGAAK